LSIPLPVTSSLRVAFGEAVEPARVDASPGMKSISFFAAFVPAGFLAKCLWLARVRNQAGLDVVYGGVADLVEEMGAYVTFSPARLGRVKLHVPSKQPGNRSWP
jgi:hypothetical protein